ncbi:hypothetical protein AGMMS50225_15920 [Betaproteobacteria bacterium]|nr:hypothetical protein AGMMS50225_15920 [Betaproteobacteria bacterium]
MRDFLQGAVEAKLLDGIVQFPRHLADAVECPRATTRRILGCTTRCICLGATFLRVTKSGVSGYAIKQILQIITVVGR